MKHTFAEQIEVKVDGTVLVRFAKQRLNEDGTPDGDPKWHRVALEPDTDIDAQVAAVNAHLTQMGEAPVGDGCLLRIKQHAAIARTPENLRAHSLKMAARKAERDAANRKAEAEQAMREVEEKARFTAAVNDAIKRSAWK